MTGRNPFCSAPPLGGEQSRSALSDFVIVALYTTPMPPRAISSNNSWSTKYFILANGSTLAGADSRIASKVVGASRASPAATSAMLAALRPGRVS
jgi:hypothetical protein